MSFEAISSFTSVYTAWQTATARTHSGDAFPPTSDELIESLTVLCDSLHTVVASKQPTTHAKKSKSRKGKKALAAAATRGAMFKDFGLPTKNQSSIIRTLTTSLTNLISHREVSQFSDFPDPTEDTSLEAFMSEVEKKAVTVSRASFLASDCYSTLISVRGAYAVGIVDVACLSTLSATMKRYCADGVDGGFEEKKTKGKRSREVDVKSNKRRSVAKSDDDDEADYEETGTVAESSSPSSSFVSISKPISTLLNLLQSPDFPNYTPDSTEQIIEIIAAGISISSSVAAGDSSGKDYDAAKELESKILSSVSSAVTKEDMTMRSRHSTVVYLLRALYPLLSMSVDNRNGTKGKVAIFNAAAECLEDVVKGFESFNFKGNAERDEEAYNLALKSAMENQNKSAAIGSVKPPLEFNDKSTQPRPVLSAIVGMLQKIAASTLDRSDARARAVDLLKKCTGAMPENESAHLIKFYCKLTMSKKANHRLFSTELCGHLLTSDFLWEKHLNTGVVANDDDSRQNNDDEDDDEDGVNSGYGTSPSPKKNKRKPKKALLTNSTETVIIEGLGERDPAACIPLTMLSSLSARLSDKAPGVRARAAQSVADILNKAMAGADEEEGNGLYWLQQSALSMSFSISDGLRKRCQFDERAAVRKSAVQGLTSILLLAPPALLEDVEVLEERCGDPSVATRKAAAEGLTKLVEACEEESTSLETAWARSVLPLVMDGEITCVTRVLELFKRLILVPLVSGESQSELYMTSWRVLSRVSDEGKNAGAAKAAGGSLKQALKRVLDEESDNFVKKLMKELKTTAVESLGIEGDDDSGLHSHLFSKELCFKRTGAWCILEGLAGCSHKGTSNTQSSRNKDQTDTAFDLVKAVTRSKINGGFLTSAWEKFRALRSDSNTPEDSRHQLSASTRACLRVMAKLASLVPKAAATVTLNEMKRFLLSNSINPDVIAACVSALTALTSTVATSPKQAKAGCADWSEKIFARCEQLLSKFVTSPGDASEASSVTSVTRALFTIGEVAMVGFFADDDGRDVMEVDSSADETEWVRGMRTSPSPKLLSLVQILLPPQLPAMGSDEPVNTPSTARALAFVTLGKLCLRDGELAKRCINLFARELNYDYSSSAPDSESVRSNALVVMGDLCIRYTNLVDRQLPAMAACLQDGCGKRGNNSGLVRRHAVLLLSSLLLQDYVKWRGLLLQRYFAAIMDDDDSVSQLAEMTLCGPLLQKNPLLFANAFVESIFVFNACKGHPIYANAASSGDNGGGARMNIYKLMLAHMTDEQRIGVTARLAKEVLGGALAEGSKLRAGTLGTGGEPSCVAVLNDCLEILVSPEIRVGRSAATEQADADDEGHNMTTEGPANAQFAAAKGKLLSKMSKKHTCEIVVPILVNLKNLLEKNKSPLIAPLMNFLRVIFKNWKKEAREVLANDPNLLAELEYDCKKFVLDQKKEKEKEENVKLDLLRKAMGNGGGEMGKGVGGMGDSGPLREIGNSRADNQKARLARLAGTLADL
ncbi:hypothetical protein TL16_g10125 [Triparma laevis f. inornata]|uniref:Condensin complex subunit 1 C-terminal domain-containing protein n=1 Tax=Triparma laevis f. inornata TaxID=1714386 RepID=A0A9W7B6K1_9STRA|nr:hypothetical protein TL16_g10125 [Triparma laevis f. inornata]